MATEGGQIISVFHYKLPPCWFFYQNPQLVDKKHKKAQEINQS
ncbi:hypothetical protein VCE7224_02919 [Vibrio celticus]|uniref:Uncharacterized protein n=1 Tax=Vibrio celticus TaxID=446372 RepID=A0A1C3JGH4_9VIBR|nr:hypothetical protein VCE7224_02919 [Vibrio celticus]